MQRNLQHWSDARMEESITKAQASIVGWSYIAFTYTG